ncbi:MAG: PHP domain-containing protein [Gammaproteobacteria bacterium]|nr:PHP domain-containing protein [Gammaproteobacteria bacterium]
MPETINGASLRYDLHCHSTASDGSLAPDELVAHAAAQGIDALALTDHDTTDGVAEAIAAAQTTPLTIIPGLEISVSWRSGQLLHVVGLCVDIDNAPLQSGLSKLREIRNHRALEIGAALEKHGISGAYAGAQKFAQREVIGRTHFASFLLENGYAKNRSQVFKRFMTRGKPGYIPTQWATLEEAVGWIRGAGGLAVVAHPARYSMTATKLRLMFAEFKALGGAGIEVVSGSHNADEHRMMGRYAQQFSLFASVGSDFHAPEDNRMAAGRLPALPHGLSPIWESGQWRGPTSAAESCLHPTAPSAAQ